MIYNRDIKDIPKNGRDMFDKQSLPFLGFWNQNMMNPSSNTVSLEKDLLPL